MTGFSNLIGERVRQARLKHKPKLTQTQLANALQLLGVDIDQAQISKIENRTRPVSDIEVVAIAKILKVAASWLLGENNDMTGSS